MTRNATHGGHGLARSTTRSGTDDTERDMDDMEHDTDMGFVLSMSACIFPRFSHTVACGARTASV